jgi:hypothetical protein
MCHLFGHWKRVPEFADAARKIPFPVAVGDKEVIELVEEDGGCVLD